MWKLRTPFPNVMNQENFTMLYKRLEELPVEGELLSFLVAQNVKNLNQLLREWSVCSLLNRGGVSYHFLVELYDLLEQLGCEDLLRE